MSIKNRILSSSNQFKHYKEKSEKLSKENKELKGKIKKLSLENQEYEKGISVIIPSYKGENHIRPLLNSLNEQTLSPDLFEIIFIINGELDSTIDIIKEFILKNPKINILQTYTSTSGASNARNIGIKLATREYIAFIDDDDFISPKYLEKLYKHSKANRVVMTNFIDINEETGEEMESPLVPYSQKRFGIIKNAPLDFRRLATITPAKSIPSFAIKGTKFNVKLKNGVDISYYTRLYPKYDFEFYFINKEEEATYYRVQRTGSISRQKRTYEFSILGRLDVIEDINSSIRENNPNKKYRKYLESQVNAQTTAFMSKYLKEHPEDKEKVLEEIKTRNLIYFPYDKLE